MNEPPFGAPGTKPFKVVHPAEGAAEVSARRPAQIDYAAAEALRQASETPPAPPPAPTYRSCVADSINECRYLDVKGIAKEIMGEPAKPIETPADLADRMAEWAANNRTKDTP